jgi:phosphohistidine phosphatase
MFGFGPFRATVAIARMLRLFILRHAKAEPLIPGKEDHERQLAPRGREDAGKMGTHLAQQKLVPEFALLSSAQRVQETWQYLSPPLPRQPQTATEPKLYNASPETLLDAVRAFPETVKSAAVVGHNPGLHGLALGLIPSGSAGQQKIYNEGLPTTGLVIVDFPVDRWRDIQPQTGGLTLFLAPSDL